MRKSETNYANTTASVKSDAEGTASENDPRLGRLHERLKVAIGERSTRAVADESGISEGTVRNLLNGGIPKLDSLLRIADATGVDVGWLATGEGPMRPVEGRRAEHGREDAPPSPGAEQWAYARQKVLTDGLPSEYASIRAVAVFAREALGDAAIRVHGGVFVDLIDAAHQLLQSGADPNLVRRLIATASGHETEST